MHSGHVPPEVVERYTQNLYNQFFKAAQGLLRLHRRAVRVGDIKARLRVGSTKLRLRGDEDGAVDLPPVHEDGATASAQEYALAHLFNPEERQVLLLLEGGPLTAKVISIRLGQTQTPRTPLKDLLRGLVLRGVLLASPRDGYTIADPTALAIAQHGTTPDAAGDSHGGSGPTAGRLFEEPA